MFMTMRGTGKRAKDDGQYINILRGMRMLACDRGIFKSHPAQVVY